MEKVTGSGGVFFRVRDLSEIAVQLREAGVSVTLDEQEHPNGRFARLQSPEGNPIELWGPSS